MRPFLLLSFVPALLMAQSASAPGEFCRVEGQVSSIVTGEPVRKAAISLTRAGPLVPGAPPAAYTTTSDGGGHFTFQNIQAGRYRLRASRNGYITLMRVTLGSAPPVAVLSLAAGQQLDGIALKMIPHAAISGRILDEEGEPAPNARVMLQRYRYLRGRKQLFSAGPSAISNDLGEYRLFGIAPGKYFLSVTPAPAPDTRSAAPPAMDYVTTWFPGVIDPAAAGPLDVAAGSQLTGIHVTLSKARTVHVSGRVSNAGSEDQHLRVFIIPRPPGGVATAILASALDGRTGAFDIANVTPGSYNLVAVVTDGKVSRAARLPLDVKNANLENLSVMIAAGIAVKGYLRAEDGSSPVELSNVTVTLQPRDPEDMFYGDVNPSKLDRAGVFVIPDVAPGAYDLSLDGLANGDYVKSIRADAIDALASGLDLTSGTAPSILEVVVSPKAATVTGILRSSPTGARVPGASVVLIPQEQPRRGQRYYYRTAVSDLTGAFSLSSLPPGEYMAFAWQDLDGDAWLDPDFMKPFEKSGEPVSLGEGDQKSVNLNLLPAPL
jgi:hypothetical protein